MRGGIYRGDQGGCPHNDGDQDMRSHPHTLAELKISVSLSQEAWDGMTDEQMEKIAVQLSDHFDLLIDLAKDRIKPIHPGISVEGRE